MGRDKLVHAGNINVDTWRGQVTMIGRVTSEEEKVKAEEIARGIKNVTEVRNYLDIVIAPEEKSEDKVADNPPNSLDTGMVASSAVAEIPSEEELRKEIAATEKKAEKDGAKNGVKAKKQDWVEYEIGKDLAASDEEGASVDNDDIVQQAQDELKELKARKKSNKRR